MFLRKTISIAILCGAAAMGQTYNLKGRVLDKAGMKPVQGDRLAFLRSPGQGGRR